MKYRQQHIVTYKDKEVLDLLRRKFSVTYNSAVVNIAFLDTELNKENLLRINGVMSATPTKGRLYSNKK